MKIFILALTLSLSIITTAQNKNDNTIIIDGKVNMEDFARFLVINDYEIENMDQKLMYLSTGHVRIKKRSNSTYRIKAVFNDKNVELSGLVQLSVFDKSQRSVNKFVEERAKYTSLPSLHKSAFEQLYGLAKKYSLQNKLTTKTIEQ